MMRSYHYFQECTKKESLKKELFHRFGAEDEAQTRDPQLGRLMLYQLSYFRKLCGRRWIRTTEGINQQIYSLPHLATLVFALALNAVQRYAKVSFPPNLQT